MPSAANDDLVGSDGLLWYTRMVKRNALTDLVLS